MHEYLQALLGGLVLGAASSLLFVMNGRILGVSGVLGGALGGSPEKDWRLAFIVGLMLTGALVFFLDPASFENTLGRSLVALIVGGVLVGAGTQLGSGCTSGHGICGIGRGSPRSIAATVTFILAGAAAVLIVRHVFGGSI